jgi:hypothetical protein
MCRSFSRQVAVMGANSARTAWGSIAVWLAAGLAVAAATTANSTNEPGAESATAARDSREMARRVDALLEARWKAAKIEPAAPASDSAFLRRAYLDLVGVIPRVSEVREFLADERPEKRSLLVDRLLASPRHATHMATTLRNRILPLGVDPTHDREALGLQKWLRVRFAKNLRYDNLVGGLMLTTGGDELGPALYFRANDLAPEKLAASVADVFLGMKLQCAQCHDHPEAEWTQRDFWGLAAFFARVQAPNEGRMASTGFRLVDSDRGEVKIPDSNETVPPKYPGGAVAAEDEWQPRRAQLATWMASRDNRLFSRATVNWAWSELFGQGLVDRLEVINQQGGTEAATPDNLRLLDELADYFVDSGFDLGELWRTLATTRAYSLSGRQKREDVELAPSELFAGKLPRPLTPEQMYDSLVVLVPRDVLGAAERSFMGSLDEDPLRMEFVRQMRPPPGSPLEFRGGTLQALMLMNGRTMAEITTAEGNPLLEALGAPFLDDGERAEVLFLAALAREPQEDERTSVVAALSAAKTSTERSEVLSDVLWALLNSTEFAFIR